MNGFKREDKGQVLERNWKGMVDSWGQTERAVSSQGVGVVRRSGGLP